MLHSTDRRHFMLSTLAGAATAAAVLDPTAARAVEPISRTNGHHFKLSLAAYSYRDLLQGNPPRLSLVDFIDDCASFGLDGTELTSYYFPEAPTEAYLRFEPPRTRMHINSRAPVLSAHVSRVCTWIMPLTPLRWP